METSTLGKDGLSFIGIDTAENMEVLLKRNRSIFAGIQFNHPSVSYVLGSDWRSNLFFSFSFWSQNITTYPEHFNVSLRFPAIMRWYNRPWPTDILFKEQMFYKFPRNTSLDWNYYHKEGFLALQYRLMSTFLSLVPLHTDKIVYVSNHIGPEFPSYPENLTFDKFQFVFPPLTLICFYYTYINTICGIIYEKNKRTREMMKLMGISSWIYWSCLFVKKMALNVIVISIVVYLLKV